MTFAIAAFETGEPGQALGQILIGDHRESFPLITTLWDIEAYENQWQSALRALIAGRVKNCALVTDVQPPQDSAGICYWALFREGEFVYFHERMSRTLTKWLSGQIESAERHIPPRIQGTPEEHSRVSEWILPIEDLRQFVAGSDV